MGVGADVESWCGRCAELTTHSIVAMVGDEPKQVLCQVCGSRHAHRTVAARRTTTGAGPAPAARSRTAGGRSIRRPSAGRPSCARSARRWPPPPTCALFDPKERYKAGQIISHPEYGRGKIENVLRSSLLVRFPIGGLKSLMLR